MPRYLLLAFVILNIATSASAQGIGGLIRRGESADEKRKAAEAWAITDAEEQKIGAAISDKIRHRFGVVQDPKIHRYVSLVGLALAGATSRPDLPWTFVVLDADGVNAFAAPGGIVHITRGLLGMVKSEAELAGILAHEIGHVTERHTVNALRKSRIVSVGTDKAVGDRGQWLDYLADKAYAVVLENEFDRGDEMDADKQSVKLTQAAGYLPSALGDFLGRLDERNSNQPARRNGLFASHPETRDRIKQVQDLAKLATAKAVVQPRLVANVTYTTPSVMDVVIDTTDKQAVPAPSSRFSVKGLLPVKAPQESESNEVVASGAARGVSADRLAKGGPNSALVAVKVSAPDVAEFKKGIV